jgi:hypothetical protein
MMMLIINDDDSSSYRMIATGMAVQNVYCDATDQVTNIVI